MARRVLTDIEGIEVGCAQDEDVQTGVTVVHCRVPFTAAVDVRGGGPGTRETDALRPGNLVDQVDAVVLSGGSVYGLAAADAVTAMLGDQGRGVRIGTDLSIPSAPIVPSAILFDLANGGNKGWGKNPPYAALGQQALHACGSITPEGRVGAGRGARAGSGVGGQGSAAAAIAGFTVAALAVVNCVGAVRHPGTRAFYAWPFEEDAEFGGARPWDQAPPPGLRADHWGEVKTPGARQATTLCVVATDAPLSQAGCQRLAVMAQDGLARAIRPIHTPFDGDVVFALSRPDAGAPLPAALTLAQLGSAAADCVSRAIARAVWCAEQDAQ